MSDFDPLLQRSRNNLDFIRFAAATLVMFSHAYPLGTGSSASEPFILLTGNQITGGSIAVAAFFFLSGFLIAASADRKLYWSQFIKARVLRIYPGFLVAVLLAIFVLGPLLTTLQLAHYWEGVLTSKTLIGIPLLSAGSSLPGVFDNNVYPHAVNGSLWTLGYEMICYVVVLVLGLLRLLKRRPVAIIFFFLIVIRLATLDTYSLWQSPPLSLTLIHLFFASEEFSSGSWLLMTFTAGMLFYLNRDLIYLTARGCVIALLIGSLCLFLRFGTTLWLCTGGAYLLFYLATRQNGRLARFGGHGDFSYGIYIYAFPVQQTIVHLFGGTMPPLLNFVLAFPVTLALAFCSWHLIEKPALRLKSIRLRQSLSDRFGRRAASIHSSP